MKKQIFDDALHIMEVQGGSFVKSLAHLYCVADTENKKIARQAFAKYFDMYEAKFAAWQLGEALKERKYREGGA